MSSINVISINPAQSAKSALHPEVFERIAREYRVDSEMTKINLSAKKTINFAFGINKRITRSISVKLLSVRAVAGLGLIGFSMFQGLSLSSFSLTWMMLILGVSLLSGLFTRFSSLISFGIFSYFGTMTALATGSLDYACIAASLISLVFMITGPGKFSTDQIIRRSLFRYAKNHARAKAIKLAENRLSYRAMRYL
ncbi:MAG: hypothetical protein K2K81_03005 [Muribaculaceae bacterium]|nr:hypothetical protein [Muribaculaceae bacterium]MDE6682381.1 hypothetical protein [Muribaculaceae bacterium]